MTAKDLADLIVLSFACLGILLLLLIVIRFLWLLFWLKKHGQRVNATISSVREGMFRGGYGYYLTARWQDPRTSKEYLFISKGSFRPLPYHPGDSIPVLIDPHNPAHYQVLQEAV